MNSQALTKRYQRFNSNNNNHKKKNSNYNYFVLPTSISLPQFPVPKDLIPVVMKDLKEFENMSEKSVCFLQVLERIKSTEGLFKMKENNYLQLLKIMLYVEEIQNNKEMRRYDQEKKRIQRLTSKSEIFKIYVDGLMEERPSVRPNDMVEIRDSQTKVLYLLRVSNVMNDHLIAVAGARFREQFDSEKLYNIRFKFQNYPLRCCHYALTLLSLYQLTPYFFPVKRPTFNKPSSNEHWFNKMIESNPEQKQAVLNIACKASYPAPYILYGPPGTGKTATLVEAICQVWHDNPSEHILVCTPSNAAADVITKRLRKYIPEHNLYRMYSPSKEGSQIDDAIIGCSNFVDGQVMMLPKELVLLKNVVICTLVACTRLLFMDFREKHFAYVFIDEAGQATEPESIIPFTLLSSTREGRIGRLHSQVVLAGDPKQLGPGVRSKLAEPILGKSMLERIIDCEPYRKNEHDRYNPSYITKLIRNYRSHPQIIRVSNELFYENELLACGDEEEIRKAENWIHLPKPKFPLIFHGVKGIEEKDHKSPSVYNMDEVKVVLRYVTEHLLGQRFNNSIVTQEDIGIVTPFAAQRLKLHRAFGERNINNIEVGTVELFQGQEKEIIILSTVRSKTFFHDDRHHIGFLSNEKRFNVAITRAKALLIIVGNPTILQTDKFWWHLLNFCKDNNACCGIPFELRDKVKDTAPSNPVANGVKHQLLINDTNFDVVKLDDGIIESSDSSMVDENEYPSTSHSTTNNTFRPTSTMHTHCASTFNPTGRCDSYAKSNTAPRSQVLLSNVEIKKLSDLKLEKAAAKKDKKQKKKQNRNAD